MFVFGGNSAHNISLNDTWKFDLNLSQWTQLAVNQPDVPRARSGHSASVYKHFMVIFGGLFELKRELNDVHVFNFKT